MKKITFALTLLCCISFQGQAQTETKKEKIKFLFSLMHQDSLINKTFEGMSSFLIATQMGNPIQENADSIPGLNYSDKHAQIIKKSLEVAKENARRLMNEDMVAIYDKYFSSEDVEFFISFYQSKSGKKMLEMLPEITKDLMAVITTKYQPLMKEAIMKDIQQMTNNPGK